MATVGSVGDTGVGNAADENLNQTISQVGSALATLRQVGPDEDDHTEGQSYRWSDENLKQTIGRLGGALAKPQGDSDQPLELMATRRRGSHRKIPQLRESAGRGARTRPRMPKKHPGIGVIAQEAQKVFPELVTITSKGARRSSTKASSHL